MKTIKRITLTLTFLVALVSINAQSFKFGIQAGSNFAVQSQIGDYYTNSDIRTGLHAGIFGNYAFSQVLSLQTEIAYDQKGSKTESIKNNFDYVTVPLFIKYSLGKSWKTPLRFNIYTGPYVGFLVNAESKDESGETNQTTDLKDNTNVAEFGILSGIGLKYPVNQHNILFDIRLGLGITPYKKNDYVPKNKYIGLSLGYEF